MTVGAGLGWPADSASTAAGTSAPAVGGLGWPGDVPRETTVLTAGPAVEQRVHPALTEVPSGVTEAPSPPAARFPRPRRRRVMAVVNQKGGVGKTTTTVNLAAAMALGGLRVLVIDLDPQGNASTGLGVEHQVGTPNVYDLLVDGKSVAEVVQPVDGIPGLSCVPATIDLAGAEIELVSVVAREQRLARALRSYDEEIDYILIDCPPSLGLLTVNALVAAEEVLIPIQCEYYALEGVGQLVNNVELIKTHLNQRLHISTILLTMYDPRTRLAEQVAEEVRDHFRGLVLTSMIPRSVRISEAPSYGQSVITYDPESRGAVSYDDAAQEIALRGSVTRGQR